MEVKDDLGLRFEMADSSAVGVARRSARSMAGRLGFCDTDIARVAIGVTEVATNILRHVGCGELVLTPVLHESVPALAVIALDKGPGMIDVERCFTDGYSSIASSGTGLGALRRQSEEVDVYAPRTGGTAILAVFRKRALTTVAAVEADRPLFTAALRLPYPGELSCGDGWAVVPRTDGATGTVVDGLGHGDGAALAAQALLGVFRAHPAAEPDELLWLANDALRHTRGAAAAAWSGEMAARRLRFAAVGNVAGLLICGPVHQTLQGQGGIVGNEKARVLPQDFAWSPGCVLVLHSDGIGRWRPDAYPGLLTRHPLLIAGVLFRDHGRPKDDVAIVVTKWRDG